jgi:FMN phosphatase YigB (HAD superfamily)
MKREFELAGFDVFDTLLVRAVSSPRAAFLLMGRLPEVQKITRCSPEAFADLRCRAERSSRWQRPETTLDAVYQDIQRALALTTWETEQLAMIECEVERRLIRTMPGADALLTAISATRRVAVSDMYLPGAFVGRLLEDAGLRPLLDDVYVSSERGTTKRAGTLFDELLAAEGVEPQDYVHIGDNARSDVLVPRSRGASVIHRPEAHLNRYERIWDSHAAATEGLSAVFGGAARLARLSVPAATVEERAIVSVATGVAAPALTAYVLWLLRSSQRLGIERLYFMARDGELLLDIARQIAPRLGITIDLRYLYGSRRVFHQATVSDDDPREAAWAWTTLHRPSYAKALQNLGLGEAEARAHLDRLGQTPIADELVDADSLRDLLADASLHDAIKVAAAGRSDLVHRYLAQEGVGDGTPYGIVDTGWTGRTAASFVAAAAEPPQIAFFFGARLRDHGWQQREVIRGYLFDEVAHAGYPDDLPGVAAPAVIETFTAPSSAMTIGFRSAPDGSIEPVLAGLSNPVLADWPWFDLFRSSVAAFVEALPLEDDDLVALDADLRPAVAHTLKLFWERPTRAEVTTWGQFVFEDDILGRSHNALVQPYRLTEVVERLRARKLRPRAWVAGSARASSPAVRVAARVWAEVQARPPEQLVPAPARQAARALQLRWVLRRQR